MRRKIDGYIWREQVATAMRANRRAMRAVGAILDERPGPTRLAELLAQTSRYLHEGLGALVALQEISNRKGDGDG